MKKKKTEPMRMRKAALTTFMTARVMPAVVRPLLCKAVSAGKLTVIECSRIETLLNERAKNPQIKLDPKVDGFIAKLMQEEKA